MRVTAYERVVPLPPDQSPATIGLFGTCGGSKWREPFIAEYQKREIPWFNPQVENWRPELADIEAEHLAQDELILFPVTDETLAVGSLAETGFSIQAALSLNRNRFVLLYIAPTVCAALQEENPVAARDSNRARKLVLAHLRQVDNPNVFVANKMEQLLPMSLQLYTALTLIKDAHGLATS